MHKKLEHDQHWLQINPQHAHISLLFKMWFLVTSSSTHHNFKIKGKTLKAFDGILQKKNIAAQQHYSISSVCILKILMS